MHSVQKVADSIRIPFYIATSKDLIDKSFTGNSRIRSGMLTPTQYQCGMKERFCMAHAERCAIEMDKYNTTRNFDQRVSVSSLFLSPFVYSALISRADLLHFIDTV